MPNGSKTGMRFIRTAISVVVPPISSTRLSSSSGAEAIDPITLAAGPESIVRPGESIEDSKLIVPPSALRMWMGTISPFSLRDLFTASKNSLCNG